MLIDDVIATNCSRPITGPRLVGLVHLIPSRGFEHFDLDFVPKESLGVVRWVDKDSVGVAGRHAPQYIYGDALFHRLFMA